MYVFIIFLFSLAQTAIVLQNCQIANLVSNTCLTCNGGYDLVNNQCLQQQTGQLTINNQFWSSPSTQIYGGSGQSSQNAGGLGNTRQVFIPGYIQPSQTNSQSSSTASFTSGSQIQNQYVIDLINYLNSQQSSQSSISTPSASPPAQSSTYSDPNCKTLSGPICLECYQSFYFNSTQKKCLTVNPLCKNSSQGLCTSCYGGYNLDNGNCIVDRSYKTPQIGDANCKIRGSNGVGCLQCYQSFYFNGSQGKCIGVNPLCKNVTKNNVCTSCWPGYTLQQGNCVVESGTASSYSTSPSLTTTNNAQSYQNQGLASFLNLYFSGQPSASTPTQPTAATTQRYGDYIAQFDSQGKLIRIYPSSQPTNGKQLQTQGVDSACTYFFNNLCQGCIKGYYLSSQGCKSIDNLCLQWTESNTCSLCQPPYRPSLSGCALASSAPADSVNTQASCFFREVRLNGVCTHVSDDCKEWNQLAQCTACYSGYQLLGGMCRR